MQSSLVNRKPIRVPRYLVHVAKRIRQIEDIADKGLIIEHPTVKTARQPTGRVQLKI